MSYSTETRCLRSHHLVWKCGFSKGIIDLTAKTVRLNEGWQEIAFDLNHPEDSSGSSVMKLSHLFIRWTEDSFFRHLLTFITGQTITKTLNKVFSVELKKNNTSHRRTGEPPPDPFFEQTFMLWTCWKAFSNVTYRMLLMAFCLLLLSSVYL